MPDAALATEAPADRYRWTIGLLLGVGVLVNYFDRVNLSVSHAALVHDFGISAGTFGQLSAAYSWTYAMCQVPTGVLLDRFGVRRISLASVAVWAVASLAAAVSPGVLLFFAARLLLGVGEAPTFPANAKAVGAWFPLSERSLATAIFDSAAKFANAVGVPLLGLLLLRVGWRMSFGFTAALSLGYMLLFALLYREPLRRWSLSSATAGTAPGEPAAEMPQTTSWTLRQLLAQRKVLGLAIGFGSYNYVFYLLLTWLPTYLQQALHLSSQKSFLYTGAPWLVATAADLLLGGVLVDALIRRGGDSSRVRQTALLAGMVCGLGILGGAFAHSAMGRPGSYLHRHRRPGSGSTRLLEHSRAAGAQLQYRPGRQHHQLCQPGVRHRRAHCDGVLRAAHGELPRRLLCGGGLSAGGDRGVCVFAGAHTAHRADPIYDAHAVSRFLTESCCDHPPATAAPTLWSGYSEPPVGRVKTHVES